MTGGRAGKRRAAPTIGRHPGAAAALLVSIVVVAGACGEDPPSLASSSRVSVRDSAGVAIVDVADLRSAQLPAWGLSAEPLVEVGGALARGGGQPVRISSATRFSDGRLMVVHDAGLPGIFDRAGAFLGSYRTHAGDAHEGAIPAGRIDWAARVAGDSLYTYDADTRQLRVVDPAGRVRRRTQLHLAGSGKSLEPLGILPDGRVVARPGAPPVQLDPTVARATSRSVPLRAQNGFMAPFPDRHPDAAAGARTEVEWPAVAPPRERAIQLSVDVAYSRPCGTLWPDGIALTLFDTTGAPVRRIRTALASPALVGDPLSFGRKGLLQPMLLTPSAAAPGSEVSHGAEHRGCKARSGVRIGVGGEYWVPEAPLGGERRAWTVYSAVGQPVARVASGTDIDLLEAGADYILGRTRDAVGGERVRVYALQRGETTTETALIGHRGGSTPRTRAAAS